MRTSLKKVEKKLRKSWKKVEIKLRKLEEKKVEKAGIFFKTSCKEAGKNWKQVPQNYAKVPKHCQRHNGPRELSLKLEWSL